MPTLLPSKHVYMQTKIQVKFFTKRGLVLNQGAEKCEDWKWKVKQKDST